MREPRHERSANYSTSASCGFAEHAGDLAALRGSCFPKRGKGQVFSGCSPIRLHGFLARSPAPKAEMVGFSGATRRRRGGDTDLGARGDRRGTRHCRPPGRALARAAKKAEVRRLYRRWGADNAPALASMRTRFQETAGEMAYSTRIAGRGCGVLALVLAPTEAERIAAETANLYGGTRFAHTSSALSLVKIRPQ